MKNFTLLLAFLLLFAGGGRAQTFPVDTLIKNGPLNRRINLVFVGDGYQASEMTKFRTDVDQMVADLFQTEPFRQYQRYFNVFAIRVPSAQSGTTHPRTASDCPIATFPAVTASTYFRTRFDNAGTHRAIVTTGQNALASVMANNFPLYTQAAVIVNTAEYGGTGGAISTITAHPSASEICIHELGHSFAHLADEYWPGPQYADERANRTQPAVIGSLRWQSWMGQNGVGNYPYAANEDPSWSRPHQNCKMRSLGRPFCSVCIEAIIERIHTGARALEGYSPASLTLSNPTQDVAFALQVLKPAPNTLKVTWKRDGVVFGGNTEQLTVPLALLTPGSHTIRAEVQDTTTLSKSVNHRIVHRYVVQWDIQSTVTGTRISSSSAEYKVETFPNPMVDVLNLSYTLPKASEVSVTVIDATGRRVKTLSRGRQPAGSYTYQLKSEELNLRQAGVYTLVLDIDGMVFNRQIVKQ